MSDQTDSAITIPVGKNFVNVYPKDIDRFWGRVLKGDGCWEWTGAKDPFGYGQICIERRKVPTHRLAWVLRSGAVPIGLCVLHKCDNPRCVKPDHLFVGTKAENTADMKSKLRHSHGLRHSSVIPHGEGVHSSKLTEDSVRTIRRLHLSGVSMRQLARDYSVAHTSIMRAVTKRSWASVG